MIQKINSGSDMGFSEDDHDALVRRIAAHLDGGNYENSELATVGMAETLVDMLTSSLRFVH